MNKLIKRPVLSLPNVRSANSAFNIPIGIECDFYLAALPRSGSTVIANMLSNPYEKSLCLIEPHFHNAARTELVAKQLSNYSTLSFEQLDMMRRELNAENWYRQVLNPILAEQNFWGVKEVRPELHNPTIEYLKPKNIIIILRELREAFSSLLEKCYFDMGNTDLDYAISFTERLISDSCRELILIDENHKCLCIPYTNEVSSKFTRDKLSSLTNLPFTGDPNTHFDFIGRNREVDKHVSGKESCRAIPLSLLSDKFEIYISKNRELYDNYHQLLLKAKKNFFISV